MKSICWKCLDVFEAREDCSVCTCGLCRERSNWRLSSKALCKRILSATRLRSRKLGVPNTLSAAWIGERLITGTCEATGIPFADSAATEKYKRNPWRPSVDRIDSNLGYTEDNCRLVVWIYNMAKGDSTDADVERMARALIERRVAGCN